MRTATLSHRPPRSADPCLEAYLLGSVSFADALRLQRLLSFHVSGDRDRAALILCEHPPLITVGRQGSRTNIQVDPEELRLRGWRVRWVNRGGGTWLHLPGQLAIYPVLALDRLGLDIPTYLDQLRKVLASVLGEFFLRGVRAEGAGLLASGRLIADCGVAVRDWVTYYGAVLNVNPDLVPFRRVRCGVPTSDVTSIERERRGPLRSALVRERFVEFFASHFGFTRTSLFFHHPALARQSMAEAVAIRPA